MGGHGPIPHQPVSKSTYMAKGQGRRPPWLVYISRFKTPISLLSIPSPSTPSTVTLYHWLGAIPADTPLFLLFLRSPPRPPFSTTFPKVSIAMVPRHFSNPFVMFFSLSFVHLPSSLQYHRHSWLAVALSPWYLRPRTYTIAQYWCPIASMHWKAHSSIEHMSFIQAS